MNYKISIIIPVYNVEKYIEQCVNSILQQNFKNIEIILVDDGSPDRSPMICDTYAEKYDCIKVIHKENGGLSDARNAGIKSATGDYVLFVDSDDFIEPDALQYIANVVSQNPVDLVFLEAQKYFGEGDVISLGDGITREGIKGKTKDEVLDFLSQCPKFPAAAWSKLIKRELLSEDLFFPKGLLSEDIDWALKLLLKAESFDYCDVMYYNYRQNRVGSITNTVGKKNFCDIMYMLKKWSSPSENYSNSEKNFIFSELAYEYTIWLMIFSALEKGDRKIYRNELKDLLWLLDYRRGARYSGIKALCKLFGFGVTSRLLQLYLKIR